MDRQSRPKGQTSSSDRQRLINGAQQHWALPQYSQIAPSVAIRRDEGFTRQSERRRANEEANLSACLTCKGEVKRGGGRWGALGKAIEY